MSPFTDLLSPHFLTSLLAGMLVNFEIAGIALVFGLALGMLLAFTRLRGGVAGVAASSVVGLMRAAPTFVVMFFLLNALPRGGPSGVLIVTASLIPYAAAYTADSAVDALRQFRAGSMTACLLILPNVARAFFVLVMSSSVGAAIGVPEGIAVILRHAEKLTSIRDELVLFALGVASFGIPLQMGFVVIRLVHKRLSRAVLCKKEAVMVAAAGAPVER
jgi:hypothetical protein